jgi:hypothetical protein
MLGSCATRFGSSRVQRANETGSGLIAFRGTRRGRFWEGPKVIHTHEIDVMGVPARSNNNGVDLVRVDNLLGCVSSLLGYFSPVVAMPRIRYFCPAMKKPMTGASETTDIANIWPHWLCPSESMNCRSASGTV